MQNDDALDSLVSTMMSIVHGGGVVSGVLSDTSHLSTKARNSVNPAVRNSLFNMVFGLSYDSIHYEANIPKQRRITTEWMPRLEAITPGGGSYLNEADLNQPNFQQAFYGSNYYKLLSIKRRYDPKDLFYGITSVGSERWEYRMNTDGKLCRKRG